MQLVLQSVLNAQMDLKLCHNSAHLAALLNHTCSCLNGSPFCLQLSPRVCFSSCDAHIHLLLAEEVTIPEVREGWHMWWHPYGEAMLPEHVTVVHPSHLPWEQTGTASQPIHEYLDQALIYNWLDQANMYHVLMETGNFIFATACKLLNACSHASSRYQILATVSSHTKRAPFLSTLTLHPSNPPTPPLTLSSHNPPDMSYGEPTELVRLMKDRKECVLTWQLHQPV